MTSEGRCDYEGLTGHGVELGVRDGRFTATLLRGWRQADSFVQVDARRPLGEGGGTERVGRQRAAR